MRASVVGVAALSPLGEGDAAVAPGEIGSGARVALREDAELVRAGLTRPTAARVDAVHVRAHGDDPATAFVRTVMASALDALPAGWLAGRRIGLALGTSSGAMRTAEEVFRRRAAGEPVDPELARGATYFAPFTAIVDDLSRGGVVLARSVHLVTACAASTWALGAGLRWLQAGEVDVVFAGGYDALTVFVAAGFEALRATTASRPAPFALGRDGMSLGEGAAIATLVREGEEAGLTSRFFVAGFGASTDAVHITAPDRSGDGLRRAGARALCDAAVEARAVGAVSAHCTSTPYNDAMEWRALDALFAGDVPPVHPFKAQIGHTLGAAGALESLALGAALAAGLAPAAAVNGALDPETPAVLLPRAAPLAEGRLLGLKLSAAFGGANAALVLASPHLAPAVRPRARERRVWVSAASTVSAIDVELVARASVIPREKVERADGASLLLATALAALVEGAPLAGAGLLVSHALATIDVNERFNAKILQRGARAAEPRLFPPTSPNLMPGQAAIFFGMTGPSAALAGGPGHALDALALARTLLVAGDVERCVVAAVDDVGETSRALLDLAFPAVHDVVHGATACLLEVADEQPGARAVELVTELAPCAPVGFGRGALEAWLGQIGIPPSGRSANASA